MYLNLNTYCTNPSINNTTNIIHDIISITYTYVYILGIYIYIDYEYLMADFIVT